MSPREETVLKAMVTLAPIGALVPIASIHKAIGRTGKRFTDQALLSLAEDGIIALHIHDWPQGASRDERKYMLKANYGGKLYYFIGAAIREDQVSKVKKIIGQKNPRYLVTAKQKTVRDVDLGVLEDKSAAKALTRAKSLYAGKGYTGMKAKRRNTVKQSANPYQRWLVVMKYNNKKMGWGKRGKIERFSVFARGKQLAKQIARTEFEVKYPRREGWTWHIQDIFEIDYNAEKLAKSFAPPKQNPARKRNKTIIKAGRIDHLDVAKVHNPYKDLVIKGFAKKTPQGWKIGRKTIPQGKGIVNVSSGYKLDRATGTVFTTRARNPRNVAQGFFDGNGVFHPIRSSADYDGGKAGETGRKPIRTRSKKRKASLKKASQTARLKAETTRRKSTASRLASRSLSRSAGILKGSGSQRQKKRNSTPAENRREFAGRYSGNKDLYFPEGTPNGLSKLGTLKLIKAEAGSIKPTKGTVWLCRDQSGKLHIGTTKANAVLFSGSAQSLGKIKVLEYDEAKPHLGEPRTVRWFHKMGEETGERPTLYADGKGGLKIRGGAYRIESRGIVN